MVSILGLPVDKNCGKKITDHPYNKASYIYLLTRKALATV